MKYILQKQYVSHFGLDLKSSDIVRPEQFASDMLNAQYKKDGTIEKRRGFQGATPSQGGFGHYVYNRVNPDTGVETPELITLDQKLYKFVTSTLAISYSGAATVVFFSLGLDETTNTYKVSIIEDTTQVLDFDLGVGIDEASPITVSQLATAINAVTDYTAVVTGVGTTPAAFLDMAQNHDLVSESLSLNAYRWVAANSPMTNPFANYYSSKDSDTFEMASFVQMRNVLYIATGRDELMKYDGQNVYRAGVPQPAQPTVLLGAAGTVGPGTFTYFTTYTQIDNSNNIYEGNPSVSSQIVLAGANDVDLIIRTVQASTGFNTGCAVVAGAQVTVNTITVDDGSGGTHTLKVGDKAYFYDNVSNQNVTRNITAISNTTITIDGAAVTVSDNAVISNNLIISLYRTLNGGTFYYLVKEFANNSFVSQFNYTDSMTDLNLSAQAQFLPSVKDRSLPPRTKYVANFNNQMILAGDPTAVDKFVWSDIDGPEFFPSDDNQDFIFTREGDIITGIFPSNESFLVFKSKSTMVLTGDLINNNYRKDILSLDIGCIAHSTIQEVKGLTYFLSDRGVYRTVSGQIPQEVSDKIEPVFTLNESTPDSERYVLKRAIGVNDRDNEHYILFLPCESSESGVKYANTNSVIYAHDYYRDAWLKWDNMNMAGGAVMFNNKIFFTEKRLSTDLSSVVHYCYRRLIRGDNYDFVDHSDPVSFSYSSSWYALGEPSVFKKFLRLKVFSLPQSGSGDFTLPLDMETDYIRDRVKASTVLTPTSQAQGYGYSEYGNAPYGGNVVPTDTTKLARGKYQSMRFIFTNNELLTNLNLTGWELEIAAPYRPELK